MNLWWLNLGDDFEPLVMGQSKPRPNKNFHMMTRPENLSTSRFWLNWTRASKSFVKIHQVWCGRGFPGLAAFGFFFVSSRSMITNTFNKSVKEVRTQNSLNPLQVMNHDFLRWFFGTKHGCQWEPIRGRCRVTSDQVWPPFRGQLEVMATVQEPSMAIFKANSRSLPHYTRPSMVAFPQPTWGHGNFAGAKYDNH